MKNQVERRFQNLKILKITKMRIDHIFGNAATILLYIINCTHMYMTIEVYT